MKRILGIALKYVLLLLLLLSFGSILSSFMTISDGDSPVIYYRTSDPVSAEDISQMRGQDEESQIQVPFTAAGSISGQSFENPDLGKTAECEVLFISGDSSIMVNSYGGQLFEDDKDACLLSSGAAWDLFGEPSVTAGTVLYNEKTYIVRGTVDYDEDIVILPYASLVESSSGSDDSDYSSFDDDEDSYSTTYSDDSDEQTYNFDRIIIRPADDSSREEYIQIFENRNSSSSNKADCITYHRIADVLMLLLPLLILCTAMIRGIMFCVRNRYKPFYFAAGIIGIAAMWFIFFKISGIKFSIPPDLIPSRWSDFDFWGKKITSFKTSLSHMLFMSKSEVELSLYQPLTGMTGMSVVMVILYFINLKFNKAQNLKKFLQTIIASLIVELIALYLMKDSATDLYNIKLFIMLWPYLTISAFLFNEHKTDKNADGNSTSGGENAQISLEGIESNHELPAIEHDKNMR